MADKYIEKFRKLDTWVVAYMRDVTYAMHHDIHHLGQKSVKVIGRAFTVTGPDIYLNALESIPEGSVYVHADTGDDTAVWSGLYADLYGKHRGLVAAVIDGGVHTLSATTDCAMPTFARFAAPRPAINRKEGLIQIPVTCGGVTVCPGDIVMGDDDGVVVIPRANEQEIFDLLDGFINGHDFFVKLAIQPGLVITEHEALKDMFELKYEHPYDYWRYYEPWSAKWRGRYDAS